VQGCASVENCSAPLESGSLVQSNSPNMVLIQMLMHFKQITFMIKKGMQSLTQWW
jgi:hypothetical protein